MDIWDYVYIGLVVLCIIIGIISTIIARKNRARSKISTESSTEAFSETSMNDALCFYEEAVRKTIELVNSAENMFNKFGISKAGELKLDHVLTKLRTFFADNNKTFDECYWKIFVENIVSTGNNIGHGTAAEVPSQSTGKSVVSANSNIDNVKI